MRLPAGLIALSLAVGCGEDGSSMSGGTSGSGEATAAATRGSGGADDVELTSADATGALASTSVADDSTSDGDPGVGTTSGDPADGTSGDTSVEPPEGALMYEPFDAPDGAPWQAAWTDVGGLLATEVTGGRGRLQGATTTVGRMVFAGVDARDVEATATVVFDDYWHQGFGLYVRQNGGYLVATDPPGQGYALYVEGGFQQLLGIWRERNGVEEMLDGAPVDGGYLESGVPHRVRFRCVQEGEQTRLQAKIWPADEAEPAAWGVDILDGTIELQDASGSVAVDIYNYQGRGSILLDDIALIPAE